MYRLMLTFNFLLLLSEPALGQNLIVGSECNIFNDSIKLYAVGESHDEKNSDLQLSILANLIKNGNIDYVVLELSVKMGEILNEYVVSGNRRAEMEVLINFLPRKARSNCTAIVQYIYKNNVGKSEEAKIGIVAVDQFGFKGFSNNPAALSIFFPNLKECGTELLQKILSTKNRKYSYKKGMEMLNSLLLDFDKNEEIYVKCLKDKSIDYKMQLMQITDGYKRDSRLNDSIRERFMYTQLRPLIGQDKTCFAIFGASHVLNKKDDTWFNGYAFTTVMAYAKSDFPNQTFSIVTQYKLNPLEEWLFGFNLLSKPIKEFFKGNRMRHIILDHEELETNHSVAAERCDMVILQK